MPQWQIEGSVVVKAAVPVVFPIASFVFRVDDD
jgi:hypothetical protein